MDDTSGANVRSVFDLDIRQALRRDLQEQHAEDPGTLIRHELGLCAGTARVDVAVINGDLSGYEIKSPRDSLSRLPGQVDAYGKVLDFAAIVTSGKYTAKIAEHVPEWWSILHAEPGPDRTALQIVRPGAKNCNVEPMALAQLLWRDEAMTELKRRDAARGLSGSARWYVWERLIDTLTLAELHEAVRSALKRRQEWSGGQ